MPFVEHSLFSPPSDPNATIWRYMDLAKFLSLIDKSALYFVRADKLAILDPFEGYYTNLNYELSNKQSPTYSSLLQQAKQMSNPTEAEDYLKRVAYDQKAMQEGSKFFRERVFINSWHMQEHESAAMWSLYAKNSEGIAIESSYNYLINAFNSAQELVRIGKVIYKDYRREAIPLGNTYWPFLHKRMSFDHEKELRVIFDTVFEKDPLDEKGIYIPVNLEKLIRRIFVSPTAEHWMFELLKSLVNKYDLNKEIVQSDLSLIPIG